MLKQLIVLLLIVLSEIEATTTICNPTTVQPSDYPGVITKLAVVSTLPLKIRAHIRINNKTDEVTFEGMVHSENSENLPLTSCRSLGCSIVSGSVSVSWTATQTCQVTCPDGSSAFRMCQTILGSVKCPPDAMDLTDCTAGSLFPYTSNSYSFRMFCTECDE